ncbi:hypothetical protein H0H87_002757, partial [Tephrocybe sp. NHM501043]
MSTTTVTEDCIKEGRDYDDAAQLLARLCPDPVKNNPEIDLGSPESFACLLYRDRGLIRRVKRANAEERFDGVWSSCT